MRLIAAIAVIFVLASCMPTTTVTPLETEERVTALPFERAYAETVNVINTQPYPSDSGGWIITESDQVGGFVAGQLNGRRCVFLLGCTDYMARVTVALVQRGGETAVSLSLNRHEEAQNLADRIIERLGL